MPLAIVLKADFRPQAFCSVRNRAHSVMTPLYTLTAIYCLALIYIYTCICIHVYEYLVFLSFSMVRVLGSRLKDPG